jgi:hypothetical protein
VRYKIQTQSVSGWSDLKYSEDDGETYQVDLYNSKEEAIEEMKDIQSEFNDEDEMYRIVTEDVEEEFNLY